MSIFKRRTQKVELDKDVLQIIHEAEVHGNVAMGRIMLAIAAFSILILLILLPSISFGDTEAGMYLQMKLLFIATIIIIIAGFTTFFICRKTKGELKCLKAIFFGTLFLTVIALQVGFGTGIELIFAMPVVLSCFYFDTGFTIKIGITNIIAFIAAKLVQMEVAPPDVGIVAVNRDVLIPEGYYFQEIVGDFDLVDRDLYRTECINQIVLTYLIFLIIISIFCVLAAKRGYDLILLQNETSKKTAVIETELKVAAGIQNGLLPNVFPAFPDRTDFDIYATMNAAKDVGGDLYDFFLIDSTHVAIVIGDVSGKGTPAALFMSMAKMAIKDHLRMGLPPAEAMSMANNALLESDEGGLFVTAWVAIIDTESGQVSFANAGHNPPLLMNEAGKYEYLNQKKNVVLSAMDDMVYTEQSFTMKHGDKLILYTDGVTEARNANMEFYGEERLLTLCNKNTELPPKEMLLTLLDDVMQFTGEAEQFDDVTMLMFELK